MILVLPERCDGIGIERLSIEDGTDEATVQDVHREFCPATDDEVADDEQDADGEDDAEKEDDAEEEEQKIEEALLLLIIESNIHSAAVMRKKSNTPKTGPVASKD